MAAVAFIGEPSYSTSDRPIAHGRPDEADLNQAREFGEKVFQKLTNLREADWMPALEVPGNFPYKERMERPLEAPSTRDGLCILCGTCAAVCPTAAVVVEDAVITELEIFL